MGLLDGKDTGRDHLIGYYGQPGTEQFKIMVRWNEWKYIFMGNGSLEQLFNLEADPNEQINNIESHPDIVQLMSTKASDAFADSPWADSALENGTLKGMPYRELKKFRINQFDNSRGVKRFPDWPEDIFQNT